MTVREPIDELERLIDRDEDNADLPVGVNQYNSGYGGTFEVNSIDVEEAQESHSSLKGLCVRLGP